MNQRIEHFSFDPHAAVRASGRFNVREVAAILRTTGQVDVRALGCPDAIFDSILAKNAARRGITPSGEATPTEDRLEIRLQEIQLF